MHKNSFFNKSILNINKQNNRGITLIALVITIIVLLILAGVSISMLTGTNGILTQASNARQATEESTEKEKRQLSQIEASTHLENYDYTDAEGNTAKIPAGFAVSNVEGENLVSKGLVIIGTTGNEYVWIPSTIDENNTTKLQYARETTDWYIENDPDDNPTLATKDELTLTGIEPSAEEKYYGITSEIFNEISKQVEKEILSIKQNGGYYIGRYETGKENEIAVVKPNKEPYTSIQWSEAYKQAKGIENRENTITSLCSSYAWDTAIKFIQTHSGYINYAESNENCNENWIDRNVKDKNGNIIKRVNEEKKLQTGLTTPKANIYDMGGNVREFTTEINPISTEPLIVRGGDYITGRTSGMRVDYNPQHKDDTQGFRTTLFLK